MYYDFWCSDVELRNKPYLLFENCLKAQSKVKKPFRLIFYLRESELHMAIEMLLRLGGQTENSIKSATQSLNRNSFNWKAREGGLKKMYAGLIKGKSEDKWGKKENSVPKYHRD